MFKKKFIDLPFDPDMVTDGQNRIMLRSQSPQTIKGVKTFSAYPTSSGEPNSPETIPVKGYVDSSVDAAAVTRSHVFTLSQEMLDAESAVLPVEIVGNKLATRLKSEGSYAPVNAVPLEGDASAGFRVTASNEIDWSENANKGRLRAGDRVTVQFQGYLAGELLAAKNQISCGDYFTLFALETGEALGCGRNYSFELGISPVGNVSPPASIPASFSFAVVSAATMQYSFAISRTGKLYCTGDYLAWEPNYAGFTEIAGVPQFKDIKTHETHAVALALDGRVYTAGDNTYGQLGRSGGAAFGVVDDLSSIVEIGCSSYGTFALDSAGTLYAAGLNQYAGAGVLGLGSTTSVSQFAEVSGLPEIQSIVAAPYGAFAIGTNGKVYATGFNATGSLGFGDTVNRSLFEEVPGLSQIESGAAGPFHTLMVGDSGALYVCGSNEYGRIGLGGTSSVNVFSEITGLNGVTFAAAGGNTSFVIADNVIYCAGKNDEGQLGFEDTVNRTAFSSLFEIGG